MEKAAHNLWEKTIILFLGIRSFENLFKWNICDNTANNDFFRKPVGKFLPQVNNIGTSKIPTGIDLPSLLSTLIKCLVIFPKNLALTFLPSITVNVGLLNVNNINTRKRCEICSKLTTKTPKKRHLRNSGVFNVHFEYISDVFLLFLLLDLSKLMIAGRSIKSENLQVFHAT